MSEMASRTYLTYVRDYDLSRHDPAGTLWAKSFTGAGAYHWWLPLGGKFLRGCALYAPSIAPPHFERFALLPDIGATICERCEKSQRIILRRYEAFLLTNQPRCDHAKVLTGPFAWRCAKCQATGIFLEPRYEML